MHLSIRRQCDANHRMRPPNADLLRREYVTEAEVERASGRRMRQTIAAARLGFPLEIDAGQRLPVGVADDEVPHPDVALAYATPS